MNKSLTKLGNLPGNSTDRSRAKSSDRDVHGLTYTRQIVIKTQEPDIPQITILKVERVGQNQFNTGIHNLQRILQRINLKKMFQGFSKMSQLTRSSKLKLVNANRLMNILKNRQKRMMSFSWLKMLNMKLKHRAKLNTGRLISKLSLLLVNKAKAKGLEKIKQFAFSKIKRSVTQGTQINVKEMEQKFQLQKTRYKSQQFSQKFIALCKKFIKPNIKNFFQLSIKQLEPGIGSEIQRHEQLRNKKGQQSNNQIVLVILNNHIISIKGLKKDYQTNLALLKDLQKQNIKDKISFYEKIEKQFENADNQIRDSFEKHKKIEEKELARIVEGQLKLWTKLKDVPLYTSRLFISAIIVKLIKDGQMPFGQFLDLLDNFLQISNDNAKLSQFKKTLRSNERGTTILVSIVNKFMELNTLGLQPIIEKGFSENEQIIMFEIKSIKDQIRDYISKFNKQGERLRLKKTFSAKKPKAPQELRDLYAALNELIGLIQNLQTQAKKEKERESSVKKQASSSSKNVQIFIKILKTFNDCLKQGDYKKWQNFLSTINKEEHKNILDLLDAINDILNEKIEQQTAKSASQIQKLKKSQAKIKQENIGLKNKNNQLDKKLKALESSRVKQNQSNKQLQTQIQLLKEKDNQLGDWQKKYNQLLAKFNKLQKQRAREKSLSASKAQNDKQITQLKQRLGIKEEQINGLKQQLKKIQASSKQQKSKNEQQKKKMQNQIDKQLKTIQKIISEFQKFKQQQENKNKKNLENQAKIKKYQIQIKKYQRQVVQLKNQTVDSINPTQYNQILSLNETLQNKINQLTGKIENLVHQLQKKQSQIKNMRNSLVKQQSNQSALQKSRAEYQALVRKTEILQNTIQSLKHDLESKTKRIQQYERLRRSDQGGRQPSKSFSKVEKNAQYSIGLIKQLNKQLQKLKRSQMTLEQINKQLQNVHHHGEDVQVLISKIQIENSDLRKFLIQKDKTIFSLQSQINRLTTQINILKSQNSKFKIQLNDKQDHIKRLQISIKERQNLTNKDIQNKNDYIKKLEGIISVSEQNVNQLNIQITKLKNKEPQVPLYVKNQAEALQNALKQLKLKDQTIRNLEKKIYDNQQKYLNDIQRLQSDLRNFNRQNDIDNLMRELKIKDDAIRNLQKKVYDNEQTFFLDKQKWEIQIRSLNTNQGQIDNLNRQLRSKDETIRNLQKKIYDNQQKYILERQKWEVDMRGSVRQGEIDNIKKELNIKIEIISNLERTIGDNDRRYLAEKQRLQNQLRNYSIKNNQSDNFQRELRSKSQMIATLQRRITDNDQRFQIQRQKLEQQIQNLTRKYEQLLSENKNISSQLQELTITIQEQRTRIKTMTSSRAINVDNIVLLLSNITASYIRIHPKPDNAINDKTAQQIFNDLTAIKNKYIDSQNDMFMHLEEYIVRFVENDIAKYRYELVLRIDELNALKDRLVEFLNNEIQVSKNALSYQYQYEVSKESRQRTADKSSYYETPAKQSQIYKITQEISEIKEKTINASRLFDSKDLRR